MYGLISLAVVLIAWAAVSARATRYSVTIPVALMLAGLLLAGGDDPLVRTDLSSSAMQHLLQATLALVLFTDATEISLHVNKRQVGKARWNTDVKALIADSALTAPDFDFADFGAGMVQYATQSDGRMDSLPAFADYFILYYNKELFKEAGLDPEKAPASWDEMRAFAEKRAPNWKMR